MEPAPKESYALEPVDDRGEEAKAKSDIERVKEQLGREEGKGGIEVKEGSKGIKIRVEKAEKIAEEYKVGWGLGDIVGNLKEEEGWGEGGRTTFNKVEATKMSGGNVDGVEVGEVVW